MRFSVDLMTGLPGENGGDLLLSAENLLGQRGLYKIALFYLQYLPQAPITKYAQDNGILTEITVNNINKGLITNFFSTDKKEEIKRLRNFQLLFRLLPILPKGMTRFILRTKLYRTFYIMPQAPLIILIDILGALFTRDYFTLSTIKGYLWEIRRKILQSIK